MTKDIDRRMKEHLSGKTKTTARMGKLELLGYFEKDSKAGAEKLEKMIKRDGHIQHWINHPTSICNA